MAISIKELLETLDKCELSILHTRTLHTIMLDFKTTEEAEELYLILKKLRSDL